MSAGKKDTDTASLETIVEEAKLLGWGDLFVTNNNQFVSLLNQLGRLFSNVDNPSPAMVRKACELSDFFKDVFSSKSENIVRKGILVARAIMRSLGQKAATLLGKTFTGVFFS